MKMSKPTYEAITGSCYTMCPRSEIILRQRENLVHLLECKINLNGERTRFSDSQKMVKEFTRSAAGQTFEPNSFRPLLVLQRTVHYLLTSVCSSSDVSWREVYEFVENRLRAVRQDITVQALTGKEVVKILAPIARFYIYAHYRFCEYEDSNFGPHLNLTQLHETLLTILTIYQDSSYIFETPVVDLELKLKAKCEIGLKDESFGDDEESAISMMSVKEICSPDLSSFENLKIGDSQNTVFDNEDTNGVIHNVNTTINKCSSADVNDLSSNGQRTYSEKHNSEFSGGDNHREISGTNSKFSLISSDECIRNRPNCDSETAADYCFVSENLPSFSHYTNVRNMEECLVSNNITNECNSDMTKCSNILRYTVMEEMLSLYLLVHLGNCEALSHALQLPPHLRKCDLISNVFEASISWTFGDHFPLIRLSLRLPPILSCALHLHLNKVQRHALGVLSVGHNSKALAYSFKDLEKSLLFSSFESLVKTCGYYGISTSPKGAIFSKLNFKWDATVLKPEKANWVEEKLKEYTISEILLP